MASFTPRMAGKIPKILGWELMPGYDYYLWIDDNYNIIRPDTVQWFIDNIGNHQALFFRHAERGSITSESQFMYGAMKKGSKHITPRINGEPILEQVNHYLQDNHFKDTFLINASTFFYSRKLVENMADNVMRSWFYEVCRWTIRDQLSLPYVLQKHCTDFALMDINPFKFDYLKFL